ncbi:hypothetical protein K501DRAFT_245305 [Backusella circina FSU 941]|nr:hypothetical protein K501DRAFT_245305 [Backusella circina FSU 941]
MMQSTVDWLHQPGNLYILLHQVLFLMSGLCTTLGTQWIFYNGAATGDSYLTQLAQYTGMVLVIFIIPLLLKHKQKDYTMVGGEEINMVEVNTSEAEYIDQSEEGPIPHKSVMKLALLDVFANFTVTVGFSIVGSGMYQVIYSSVVIWCAILTYFLMGRGLSKLQWIAIFGTSAGLAVSSLGNFSKSGDDEAGTPLLMFGTLMTLGGTFFYSCVYVYSDYIMSQQVPAPLPARVCAYTGLYTSFISLVWIGIYTLPRFDSFVHLRPDTSVVSVLGMYLLVILSNGCHSWNYYELIEQTGSVATGILQGLRAVLIYIISDAWYCSSDSAQCFTMYKGLGSIMVIGCVLLFTVGRQNTEKKLG